MIDKLLRKIALRINKRLNKNQSSAMEIQEVIGKYVFENDKINTKRHLWIMILVSFIAILRLNKGYEVDEVCYMIPYILEEE